MLLIFPILAYVLIFRTLYGKNRDWRSATIEAGTCWAVFLAVDTEVLSAFRLITRPGLSLSWLGLCLAWLIYDRLSAPSRHLDPRQARAPRLERTDWWLLGGAGMIAVLVGVTGLLSPPNTWDAVSYHMSRVTQWTANHDVFFYPTFYSAQLFLSPWAEYAILHFGLLFGSDRVAYLVEWLSFVGMSVTVSLIARALGANRRGQVMAALACATIPEAILEGSGAMNTCVGAFWVVVAVYFFLRWREEQDWGTLLGASAATGLAVFTKGTAYAYLPAILLACWWMAAPPARWRMLARLPVFVLVLMMLNGPLFVRNYQLSGSPLGFPSPLGDDPQRQYANSRISASIAAANTVKNLALHIGTPSDALNGMMQRGVVGLLRKAGVDPDDPASTYRGGFHLNRMSSHESMAGNPLHLLLFAIACVVLLLQGRRMRQDNGLYAAGVIVAFIMFCSVVRWQMWNSRYHLPVFALGCALIGTVLARYWSRAITASICGLLVIAALPFSMLNALRPLAPWRPDSVLKRSRQELYFTDFHESVTNAYMAIAREIKGSGCSEIGIDGSLQDFDYPLFALLSDGTGNQKVKYAGVNNLTARYARKEDRKPCSVICLRCADAPEKMDQYREVGGRATVHGDSVVFSATAQNPNTRPAAVTDLEQDPVSLVEKMKHEVESLRSADLGPVARAVDRAVMRFPSKKNDLTARLDGLYMERVDSWRIEHSADPIRRVRARMEDSGLDLAQAMAAEETLRKWVQELPRKVEELGSLTEQLYESRDTVLIDVRPAEDKSGNCQAKIRTVRRSLMSVHQDAREDIAEERWLSVPASLCGAAKNQAGAVIERKPFGKYDSESERLGPLPSAIDSSSPLAGRRDEDNR